MVLSDLDDFGACWVLEKFHMDARRSRGPRGRSGGQAGGEGAFIYYLGRGLGDLFCRAVDQRGQGAQGWSGRGK